MIGDGLGRTNLKSLIRNFVLSNAKLLCVPRENLCQSGHLGCSILTNCKRNIVYNPTALLGDKCYFCGLFAAEICAVGCDFVVPLLNLNFQLSVAQARLRKTNCVRNGPAVGQLVVFCYDVNICADVCRPPPVLFDPRFGCNAISGRGQCI